MTYLAVWLITLWAPLPPPPPPLPTVPAVTLTAAWSSIPLPDTPLDVVEHDGDLWVCGYNEMIAVSHDAGAHWTVLHEKAKGDMLFTLAFPAPGEIQAYGTRGLRVGSSDEGQSWSTDWTKPGVEFLEVTLDGSSGFAANRRQFGWSSDGGASWTMSGIPWPHPSAGSARLEPNRGILRLDARHGMVLFGSNAAITADQGKTWHSVTFDSGWNWSGLRVEADQYKIYGYYAASASAVREPAEGVSRDGNIWQLDRDAPAAMSKCSAEGCLVDGGWADLRGPVPQFFRNPKDEDQPLTMRWAASGATFCRVSVELRCRTGLVAMAAPAPGTVTVTVPPKPIHSPDPQFPDSARASGEEGEVDIDVIVEPDGRIGPAAIMDATTPDFATQTITKVKQWTFHPATMDGKPIAAEAQIEVYFRLNHP